MKYTRYILLSVFTVIFAIDLVILFGIYFSLGFSGSSGNFSGIALALLTLIIIITFSVYLRFVAGKRSFSKISELILTLILFVTLPIPLFFSYWSKKANERFHTNYENTCRVVALEEYSYKFCKGGPGIGVSGVQPLGCENQLDACTKAMRLWDQKGWKQYDI